MLRRAFKFRNEPEKDAIFSGYAFRYDEIASYWGEERMSPDLKINVDPDCLLLRGHNPDKILGRRGKNFQLENKKAGLYFRVLWLPETELAKDTETLCKAGILEGVSVGFFDQKSRMENKVLVFEEILLKEISIVSWPAYDSGRIEKKAEITYLDKKPYKKVTDTKEKPPDLYL